jgi:hypothetical protein
MKRHDVKPLQPQIVVRGVMKWKTQSIWPPLIRKVMVIGLLEQSQKLKVKTEEMVLMVLMDLMVNP